MLDWLIRPRRQKAAVRRGRRRRAIGRILPSAALRAGGGGMHADPFTLYPCTRMHGADFEAEFNAGDSAGDIQYI